jgi:hypothetical protein
MGKIIKHNLPCPDPNCGSSDALQYYENETGFCWSCTTWFSKEQCEGLEPAVKVPEAPQANKRQKLDEIKNFSSVSLKDRRISKGVCEFFGVKMSYASDGEMDAHYYPYEDGYKVRKLPKDFTWLNKNDCLFGKERFAPGGLRVIICEGEIDTLSVAQMSYDKYKKIFPVVGLSSSAMAEKSLMKEREWLRSFKEVVWAGDEDEAGYKAREIAIKIVGIDKIKLVKLPKNDCNAVLCELGSPALFDSIWNAQPYVPAGIIGKEELWEALVTYNQTESVPFPDCLDGVNKKVKGHRGGEITLFVSGTGSGKSTLLREDMLHILSTTEDKIGVISLEESPAETARKLAGMTLLRNPSKDEIPIEELKVGFDAVFGADRVVLLDHQGSINDSSIVDQLEYMCLVGCKYLYIDHITILVSEGAEDLKGNEAIDFVMNSLLRLVKRHTDVWIGLVSHLRKVQGGGKSFEEGRLPTLDDIKGCLGYDTEVLLANGKIIDVQDIVVGTQLIGGDGKPCNVVSLRQGRQQMYRITMKTSNDSFICNADHILTLSHNDKLFDMSVKDFLKQSDNYQFRCKQHYSEGYNLPEQAVLIPPYTLGAWLGDGSKSAFRIMDASELGIAEKVAFEINATLKVPSDKNREYYNFVTDTQGEMLEKLRDLNVLNNKHIPECYKYNSRDIRLKLLAGLIDTDGTFNVKDQTYYFWQKDVEMAYAVRDIARSLGFYSTVRNQKIQSNYASNGSLINCVSISGELDEIPCLKKSGGNKRNNALKRGITIEKLDEQDYYGFTLDNNGRFLLGNHIITHNSGSIKQICFDIIAFARDLTADEELIRNTIIMSVLKSRFSGLTGKVPGAIYDYDTGRLSKCNTTEEFVSL